LPTVAGNKVRFNLTFDPDDFERLDELCAKFKALDGRTCSRGYLLGRLVRQCPDPPEPPQANGHKKRKASNAQSGVKA